MGKSQMNKHDKNAVHQNGGFGSSVGFVLACVGSAVGMGNIWMFPYRLGQYGGGAFLIPYIIFVAIFGLVGLSAEFAIGRRAGTGTLGAYEYCWNKIGKGKLGYILGWIPLLGSLGIAIGYSVIVGWVVRSLAGSLTGEILTQDAAAFFAQANGDFGSIPWHLIVVAASAAMLMFGVTKGIEKVNKVLMPAFFILFAIIAVRVAFLPGAEKGYEFLFVPDWSKLLEPNTWVMAMGQAFFSLSITGSGMIVYGTYLAKSEDIPKASVRTAVFDTIAAMLAALAIMPAVFAFGIEPSSGPPLMFITLPVVFQQMPFGSLFAVLFFIAVLFAALTSLMNLFETPIEAIENQFKISRKAAVCIIAVIAAAVGVMIESGDAVGAWMDAVSIYIVPLGAVLAAIMFFWVCPKGYAREQVEIGCGKKLGKWFEPVTKYVFVGITLIVYVLGIFFGGIG